MHLIGSKQRLTALLIVALLAAAACGGEKSTPTAPSPSPSSTPTATPPPPAPQMKVSYSSQAGDYVGAGKSGTVTASEASFSAAVGCRNNKVSGWVNSSSFSFLFTFSAPNGAPLTPGTYENAGRHGFQPAGQPGLDIDMNGLGCNSLSGRFTVQEALYAPDETVERFRVTFEQRCQNFTAALTGEIVLAAPPPDAARRQFYMGCQS
jgi:hypothetical protein